MNTRAEAIKKLKVKDKSEPTHQRMESTTKRGVKRYGGGANEKNLEARSKKAGWYVHGHKNYGDVYEA
jgi:hypothetical protein